MVLCGSLPAGLPPETYGSLTSYAVDAGVPVILNAGGSALRYAAARGPALVIPDDVRAADSTVAALMAAGTGAVVLSTDGGIRAVTRAGEWHAVAGPARPREPAAVTTQELNDAGRRDALVAGFAATLKDPAFLADAQKLQVDVDPVTAAEIETLLAEVYATPKDIIAKAAKAIAN